MRVLLGCEESQAVCLAFRAVGHEAFSCDLQPCSGGHPEWHLQMDIFEAIRNHGPWDMLIAFPDCTFLTVTGNKWLKDQPARKSGALVGAARREARSKAIQFVKDLWDCGISEIALENPVGVLSTEFRKPDQIIQPFQFGHPEPKKTCLWLKGLPLLKPTNIIPQEPYHITKSGKTMPKWYAYADKSKGQAERAKIRSKTFQGIADAMAQQWGIKTETQGSLKFY